MMDRYLGCILGALAGQMKAPPPQPPMSHNFVVQTERALIVASTALAERNAKEAVRTVTHYLLRWVIQDSAGGIVRLAPSIAGLMCQIPCGLASFGDHDYAFELGSEMASAIGPDRCEDTPGGIVAALVSRVLAGASVQSATLEEVGARHAVLGETLASRLKCLCDWSTIGRLPTEVVHSYGQGRCEDALLKGISSALLNDSSFEEGVVAAMRFDGDRSVAAALAGALLGSSLGDQAIPAGWLADLVNRNEAQRVTESLYRTFAPKQ